MEQHRYIIYWTFISMADDKELIHVKNRAAIICHCRTFNVTKYAHIAEQLDGTFMSFI